MCPSAGGYVLMVPRANSDWPNLSQSLWPGAIPCTAQLRSGSLPTTKLLLWWECRPYFYWLRPTQDPPPPKKNKRGDVEQGRRTERSRGEALKTWRGWGSWSGGHAAQELPGHRARQESFSYGGSGMFEAHRKAVSREHVTWGQRTGNHVRHTRRGQPMRSYRPWKNLGFYSGRDGKGWKCFKQKSNIMIWTASQ